MLNNLDIECDIMLDSLSSWFRAVRVSQLILLGSPICHRLFHKASNLAIHGCSFALFSLNWRNL
ncbi:hypothetical protein HanIR_Chr13g0630361 [Helianthus annuus]|nr:hypothetical protein HanIR_Chr13g0630361 [Helianthus annuus]